MTTSTDIADLKAPADGGARQDPAAHGCGARHGQAALLFLALVLTFAMRVNMSMAVVAMTDASRPGTFDWDVVTQSVILSSFFWGYIVLQIPGGEISARFGGKTPMTMLVFVNALASLCIPSAAYYGGWKLVCACRVLQGLAQGFLFPTIHCLISKWIPLEEKSKLGTFIYAGAQLGTAAQLMAAGFLAEYWGWEYIFYSVGVAGVAWTLVYAVFGADSPETSKFISKEERLYIQSSLGQVGGSKKLKTPWKSILTSLPFLSLLVVHCGHNWGFWTLMTEMPSYMDKILHVDVKSNGVMSALPYLAMYLMSFPLGYLADISLRKKWISVTACRKISNSLGHWGPAIALIVLCNSPPGDVAAAVAILTAVVGLNAGQYTGYLLVHIDMSPNFGGTLMGITNMAANIVSIVAPLAAGLMLRDESDPEDWKKVFYVTSLIYFLGNLFFVVFGSSQVQPWNQPPARGNPGGVEDQKENTSEVKKH